jgi:aminoacrylate hydrolase
LADDFLLIDGLFVEEHGPADAPPVILSPGLGGSAAYWAPNLAALAENHRVILYDHRGTGRSDRALRFDVTVDHMADDVLAILDGLSIPRAALIGHAAGGVIGFSIALRYPARLSGLVAVNAWPAPDPHFLRCFEARLALLRFGVRAFVRAQPIFLYPARWSSENAARIEAEEVAQIEHFQGQPNVEARIAALSAFDISARLAEIGTQTFLVAAEDDMLVPASCSERLADGLPDAILARTSGGHACNVTNSEAFDDILRTWLTANALRQGA